MLPLRAAVAVRPTHDLFSLVSPSILILRLSSLGDVVLTTPLVRALRARYPESRIDLVLSAEYASLAPLLGGLTEVHLYDKRSGRQGLQALRDKLRGLGYDVVLDLHNVPRTRLLRRRLAPNVRVVNKRTLLRWLLVHFKYDGLQAAPDVIGRYFETASSLGITDDGRAPVLTLPRPVETTPHRVAIAPGSRHGNKQWPTEHHVTLARTLLSRGYELVYYGSTSETALVEEIRQQLPADARHTSLAGALDLSETARSLAGCAVAVVNDSGLMHVARAVGTPVVALFGPTVRAFGFAPRVAAPEAARAVVLEVEGLSCRPCTAIGGPTCPKGHFRCMQAITPEQVLAAVTFDERTATP